MQINVGLKRERAIVEFRRMLAEAEASPAENGGLDVRLICESNDLGNSEEIEIVFSNDDMDHAEAGPYSEKILVDVDE